MPGQPQTTPTSSQVSGPTISVFAIVSFGSGSPDVMAREEPRRDGDAAVLVASSARARALLGWAPEHAELDDIVGSAWAFAERRRAASRP